MLHYYIVADHCSPVPSVELSIIIFSFLSGIRNMIMQHRCKFIVLLEVGVVTMLLYYGEQRLRIYLANTNHLYITFIQRRPSLFTISPIMYKCSTNVLCLLRWPYHNCYLVPLTYSLLYKPVVLITVIQSHDYVGIVKMYYCYGLQYFWSQIRLEKKSKVNVNLINLFTTIRDGNFRRHFSMNVTIK